MRRSRTLPILLTALLPLAAAACAKKEAPPELPVMARLAVFNYDPAAKFEDRIGKPPEKLLEQYRLMDARPDYLGYAPSPAEKKLIVEYLRLMPPVVERLFREKCVGLYFVKGFAGNGMTNWVVDEKGGIYFHMVLNPASLRQTLSETLTERERSCFIPADGWKISVDAGEKYKGLAYALFHEASHAADYIEGITPLVEPDFPGPYRPRFRGDNGLFTGVWKSYSVPAGGNDYPGRDRLTFYGLGGGPKIASAQAPEIYAGLGGSPFVSLYGSKSWAEDQAELTAYGLITGRLGQPYVIRLTGPGVRKDFYPMSGRAGARAAAALALLERPFEAAQ